MNPRKILMGAVAALLCLGSTCLLAAAQYTNSESCQGCHAEQYERWLTSHHYQAMREADEQSVVGNFNDTHFDYGARRHRFFRRDGGYWVETDNAEGEMQEFRIAYTFGFYPLQQYLIGFPDGRFQALNIVWDDRPRSDGGQRWYHLYPDEVVEHDDGLHWTGAFQNWNSRCASCHSTGLKKNYRAGADHYETSFKEINVACEACHGPGSTHIEWAGSNDKDSDPGKGFSVDLANHTAWVRPPGKSTASLQSGPRPDGQSAVCGACHARRSEMGNVQPTHRFSDLFQLRLLEEDLYFPDGQIREEVYVLGSFLQSKMYAAGVGCSNCHDPHSNELKVSGNGLCAQCHDPGTFDSVDHHFHEPGTTGAACVSCHMPERTYMGVDGRRDHKFLIPDPALSAELGTPNACSDCHSDRDSTWADKALRERGISGSARTDHNTEIATVLAGARANNAAIAPPLRDLANDPSQTDIVRATAILETGRFPDRLTYEVIREALHSRNDLIRAAAVRSADWLGPQDRYAMLQRLITDPARNVRMEVANRLADIPVDQIPPAQRAELQGLRNEYLRMLNFNADMPESLMNLGVFLQSIGQPVEAERAYLQALKLAPRYVPAMLNLADLYRGSDLDSKAEPLLLRAIEAMPDRGAAYHALGLLEIRRKNMEAALEHLSTANRLEPNNQRFAYVYAVALHQEGFHQQAITILETALEANPGNRELINALISYYQQAGNTAALEELRKRYPPSSLSDEFGLNHTHNVTITTRIVVVEMPGRTESTETAW